MMKEIQDLLAEKGPMTLRQIARHLKMEPQALQPMLQLLMDKGRLSSSALCGGGCSSCHCAKAEDLNLYTLNKPD